MRTKPLEVVRVRSRQAPRPATAPLPAAVMAALAAIVRDMRDVPRDCLRDPAELVIWLRRMAGRVDGVAALRVALPSPTPKRDLVRTLTVRDRAEAVLGTTPSAVRSRAPRTVTDRQGRRVRVEFKRAGVDGQGELFR